MIPIPYHFRGMEREVGLHPDVLADIEAARNRAAVPASRKLAKPNIGPHRRWTSFVPPAWTRVVSQ